jgi:hypothetical protein
MTPAEPCPTCSGRTRETVDMICQTCGRDFLERTALDWQRYAQGLTAEVERLTDERDGWQTLRDEWRETARKIAAQRDEAEAQVQRVRALADEWDAEAGAHDALVTDPANLYRLTDAGLAGAISMAAHRLRAALAAAHGVSERQDAPEPARQRCEAVKDRPARLIGGEEWRCVRDAGHSGFHQHAGVFWVAEPPVDAGTGAGSREGASTPLEGSGESGTRYLDIIPDTTRFKEAMRHVRIYHALTGTTTETKADYTLWPPQPAACADVLRDHGDVGPCVLSGSHDTHDDGRGITWSRKRVEP